ncbi:MAG TPA: aminotransferase class III-fold pyridoxal phosphate-dependent enzyme, partial [Phycisphaeraceae bacterium]
MEQDHRVSAGWRLFDEARRLIPLGTGTHSKAARLRGVEPPYYVRGQGAYLWDLDGNRYIDFRNALGPITLGYSYPPVQEAIARQLQNGIVFSAPHPLEVEVARELVEILPGAQMVRYLKTGGEAMAAAIKLARAYTGREHIVSCGYHGWLQTLEGQQGILQAARDRCHAYRYGDIEGLETVLNRYRGE